MITASNPNIRFKIGMGAELLGSRDNRAAAESFAENCARRHPGREIWIADTIETRIQFSVKES